MKRWAVVAVACLLVFGMVLGTLAASENLPVPKKRYRIGFSNGEMSNSWRWAFVDSMQEWAHKFRNIGPGIDYVWTNAGNDSAKQLMDCENLLAMGVDILIVSPNQDEPLDPVIDMCTAAGVPLIVIDRSLVRQPGVGTYVANITQNYALSGAYQAAYALEWLKAKYGAYKGNIVEIQGIIGASPTTDEYVGIRAILKHYPDVKIIATAEGGYSQVGGRQVMEDFLQRFGPGQIDLVICYNDAEALGAIEAIEAAGRRELLDGRILGKDQQVTFVEQILAGRGLMTTECPPYYGPYAIPTAIRYLNGEQIPKLIHLPLRNWENPRGPVNLVPAKNMEEILKRHIKFAKDKRLALIPPEAGDFEALTVDLTRWKGYEDVMEYTRTRTFPKGIKDLQNM
ncbi:MAG: substrate-binding domain-containing protein [Firmicutes bacterium]|jgi:ABC-type sugar transport system substrate-binding protein|nr:substrate-binding domain-containing protein [Bacillota bacterium]